MYFYLARTFPFYEKPHIWKESTPGERGCDVDHTDLNSTNPCTEILRIHDVDLFLFLAYCYMAIPCRFAPSYPCQMIDR
jgi:hypothetical protein